MVQDDGVGALVTRRDDRQAGLPVRNSFDIIDIVFPGGRGVLVSENSRKPHEVADSTRKARGRNRLGQGKSREVGGGGDIVFGDFWTILLYTMVPSRARLLKYVCTTWCPCLLNAY